MRKGYIHSFQSMGAVDGPGLRCVVFFQGCPLRCAYCHNPDTWELFSEEDKDKADSLLRSSMETDVRELTKRILRFRTYFQKGGGVTASGGEPLIQREFVTELFRELKKENIHTALDTSGTVTGPGGLEVLDFTDLVICDIKFPTNEGYKKYCKGSLQKVLDFLKATEEKSIPLWIRHVAVPGLTDSQENADKIIELAKEFKNLEKIEFLPFHKMCAEKYEKLGIPFPLKDVPECPEEIIKSLRERIPESLR